MSTGTRMSFHADLRHPEPDGVVIHDPETDELLEQVEWTIVDWEHRRLRRLRLRVARGRLVEIEETRPEATPKA